MGISRDEFSVTCLSPSAIWLRRIASLMPAPRFVRRNSTSAFRSVSIFSGRLGTASATADMDAGTDETKGAGGPLDLTNSGVRECSAIDDETGRGNFFGMHKLTKNGR